MSQFIKTTQTISYKDDPYYQQVNELIGIDDPKLSGSYLKYGRDKACDMDLSEPIGDYALSDYFQRLNKNKKKFHLVYAYFNVPYDKLKVIKDKLGYLGGNFKKFQKGSIMDDINNLPTELKNDLTKLSQDYIKTQKIEEFIKIKLYVANHLYPKWTLKQLINGKVTYYDQEFNISSMDPGYFYIEIIYDNVRASNYIVLKKEPETKEEYITISLEDSIYDEHISYYKLLKKILFLFKWLYFNKKITDPQLLKGTIETHNNLFNFIDNLGTEHNQNCYVKNQIDIYKLKLKKYNRKMRKYSNKKYQKYIDTYKKAIEQKIVKYSTKQNQIDQLAKREFDRITLDYQQYLAKYVRIV